MDNKYYQWRIYNSHTNNSTHTHTHTYEDLETKIVISSVFINLTFDELITFVAMGRLLLSGRGRYM